MRSALRHAAWAAALIHLVLFAAPAVAAWSNSSYLNNAVCTAGGDQSELVSVDDGAGGSFLVWRDGRGASPTDIYAQHVLADGTVAWAIGGIVVVAESGNQSEPAVCSDGSGGIVVAWTQGQGSGNADIYVQRIDAGGNRVWAAAGVLLCNAVGDQYEPRIVADGGGGAIVGWSDTRGGGQAVDIYARRVNSLGTPLWTANGTAICTFTGIQDQLSITPGAAGTGGAFFAWADRRSQQAVYAQYLNAAGSAQWTVGGMLVRSSPYTQSGLSTASDGEGGVLLVFQNFNAIAGSELRTSYLRADGVERFTSTSGYVALSLYDTGTIAPDGVGGAILASRGDGGLRIQRLSPDGVQQWANGGILVAPTGGYLVEPHLLPDGQGNAIVAWSVINSGLGQSDVFAQYFTADGVPLWSAGGANICRAYGSQYDLRLASDGDHGAIIAWVDNRNATRDIFCQRVERFGELGSPEPVIASVVDVPHDQGGKIRVSWNASYLDAFPEYRVAEYRVWRAVGSQQALLQKSGGAAAWPTLEAAAATSVVSSPYVVEELAGTTVYWELVGTQPSEGEAGYAWVVSTTADSTALANDPTLVRVTARAGSGAAFWQSQPDSAYSVDNLAPAAVQQFEGANISGITRLHWQPNTESDLLHYRLHASADPAFVPDGANFVAAPPDTGFVAAAAADLTWKIAAVDVHGNVGPYVAVQTGGVTAVGDSPVIARLVVNAPAPNPFNPSTTVSFTLPAEAVVTVTVHDAAGRRVRRLAQGAMAAGAHRVVWDGCDDAGSVVASGAYFGRVGAGGEVGVVRMSLVK